HTSVCAQVCLGGRSVYCCAVCPLTARTGAGTLDGTSAETSLGELASNTARHCCGSSASVRGGFGLDGLVGFGGAAIRASQSLSSFPQPSPAGGAGWFLQDALSAGHRIRM